MGIADPLDPDYPAELQSAKYQQTPPEPYQIPPTDIVGQPNTIAPVDITGSPQSFAQGVRNIIRPPVTTISGPTPPLYEDTSASDRAGRAQDNVASGFPADWNGYAPPKSRTEQQIAALQGAQGLTPSGSTVAPTPGGVRQPISMERDDMPANSGAGPAAATAGSPASPPPSAAGRPIAIAGGPPKPPAVDKVSRDLQDAVDLNKASADAESGAQTGLAGQLENRSMEKQKQADEAEERADKELYENKQEQERQRADAEQLANFKVDPNRLMASKNWLQRSLMILSTTAGGALAGLKGGPNIALEQINKDIDRDIRAQEQEYEAKKAKGQAAMNLYAMNLRALGNHDAAVAASKAQAMDAANDHFQAAVAATNSPISVARAAQTGNKMQTEKDLWDQQRADALARAAAGGKPFDEKRYDEAEKVYWERKGAAGETGTADEARAFALRSVIHNGQVAGGGPNIPIGGKKEKDPGDADKQRQIEATQEALDHIAAIKKMMSAGGQASPARTAEGKSLVGGTINAMSRAETSGNRAPGEAEQKLIREQVPSDPNAYQFTGAEQARLEATEKQLQDKLDRLQGHTATAAALGGAPQ